MTITLNGTSGIVNDATDLSYTGTLTGGTGVVNIGSGQVYKDASGNVGIGTSSPFAGAKLTAAGAIMATGAFSSTTGSSGGIDYSGGGLRLFSMGASGSTKGSFTFIAKGADNSSSTPVTIDSSGSLLVGTTATGANAKLEVKNNSGLVVYFYNDAGTGVYLGAGATSWTAASDARIKTALVPFENAAEKVCTLRAGTGRYLADEETVSRSFLIAQDVQAVLPEAVNVRDDEIGTLGLQYTDVIPLLTAAIQEQQTLITALTTRITALEGVA